MLKDKNCIVCYNHKRKDGIFYVQIWNNNRLGGTIMKDKIELQFSEFENNNMSDIKKDMLIDDLNGLGEINKGEIRLDHVFSFIKEDGVELGCFIRNATASEVFLGNVSIKLINRNNGVEITKKCFNMMEKFNGVGENKARYFDLFFPLDDNREFEEKDLELEWGNDLESGELIEIKYPFLDELGHEEAMVREFIEGVPPIFKDEVKVDCFSLQKGENGGIEIIILVRNSCETAISLKKINIKLTENDDVVAGGEFETEFIKVDALSGKLYRFPIREEHVYKSNIKLDNCEVTIQ